MSFDAQNTSFGQAKPDPSLYFRDGRRRIDMVLAFEEDSAGGEAEDAKKEARSIFEQNLRAAGLELELEDKEVNETYCVVECCLLPILLLHCGLHLKGRSPGG